MADTSIPKPPRLPKSAPRNSIPLPPKPPAPHADGALPIGDPEACETRIGTALESRTSRADQNMFDQTNDPEILDRIHANALKEADDACRGLKITFDDSKVNGRLSINPHAELPNNGIGSPEEMKDPLTKILPIVSGSAFAKLPLLQQAMIDRHIVESDPYVNYADPEIYKGDKGNELKNQLQKSREFFSNPEQLKLLEIVESGRRHTSPSSESQTMDPNHGLPPAVKRELSHPTGPRHGI